MAQFTIYRSSEANAPTLNGTTGSLITVLDACLINGYSGSVTSITRLVSTATVTTATAHGFYPGNIVSIAGANEAEYNGSFVITTVLSTTQFEYTLVGTPATPATGTITFTKLGAGWTKVYSGASKAAYRGTAGTQLFLRVQDDGPGGSSFREARITGYETMTDVDTGSNPFPTAAMGVGGIAMVVVRKSTTLNATARTWLIAADQRTIYMFVETGDQAGSYYGWMFGEIFSFQTNDIYNSVILGRNIENSFTNNSECMGQLSANIGSVSPAFFIARGHTHTVGSVNIGRHGDGGKQFGEVRRLQGVIPYTNPEDGNIYVSQCWVHDPTTIPVQGLRGRKRGFYCWSQLITSIADRDEFGGVSGGEYDGKRFLIIKFAVNGNGIGSQDGVYVIETSPTLETN